jgi:hypothetical protein
MHITGDMMTNNPWENNNPVFYAAAKEVEFFMISE